MTAACELLYRFGGTDVVPRKSLPTKCLRMTGIGPSRLVGQLRAEAQPTIDQAFTVKLLEVVMGCGKFQPIALLGSSDSGKARG
jgi:hypothetical protein